jgi:hypothetical protein
MSHQIDLTKVKAAVQRYVPNRLGFTQEKSARKSAPVDSGRRKIMKSVGDHCPGFGYKSFIQ